MTKPTDTFVNPFASFDPSKLFADLKVPGVDANALAAAQQKNLEALTAANKRAYEGYQALAKRQAEIFQEAVADATTALKGGVATVPDATAAKAAVEKAVANLRELADMLSKTNTEAFDLINKRMNENLEEFKKAFVKKA
jgi:phasin family protein